MVGRFLLSLRYSTRASSQEEQASTQVEKEQASSRAKENKGFQPSSNEQRPPAKQPSIKKSLQGMTPLLQAAATGQGNVVKLLVDRRACLTILVGACYISHITAPRAGAPCTNGCDSGVGEASLCSGVIHSKRSIAKMRRLPAKSPCMASSQVKV